ncbi:SDR family oxidoreductase [Varunaivibrio sulfuroxidans]|uniref:UDP-glucose 4-epimerase n=1 Tax=Varunaivibrio sulfuroxidans TaxID=1773489 RepID=A0A4R3JFS5_9PROT|nr:SDR family oxidoreductase [Varunaivibrio sulfuroxidans]TCS64722.1 UDP-glucose 4-epimerase [Varunaivibrio sulfuroxidans]WES29972.1 SDR family oxidoreductase [Varunaivibrio sulfuroxidans]
MTKALVTGGAGFIGSHLAELLISEGCEVIVVDNLTSGRMSNLSSIAEHAGFTFIDADIRDIASLKPAFKDVDWVFHLAGLADIVPSIEMPGQYFSTNVTGTFNVLECARNAGAERIVYAASSSSYGIPEVYPTPETSPIQPQYPYALTKYMGEELTLHWAQVYGLDAISLRLFNVYGTRSRTSGAYGAVFGVFLAQKLSGRPFTVVGDGQQTRDFTYVTDVAQAFLAAAQSHVSGEAMNVGSGGTFSINRLVELLGGEVEFIPKRPGEPDCTFADINKINTLLGWRARISFEEGVGHMLEHITDWRDAPVWDPKSIDQATEAWFQYLGD